MSIRSQRSNSGLQAPEADHRISGLTSLTVRSVVVGMVLIVIFAVVTSLSTGAGVIPEIDTSDFVPYEAAVVSMLLLLIFNLIVSRAAKRLAFIRSETIIVYNMVTIGGFLMGRGFFWWTGLGTMVLQVIQKGSPKQFSPILAGMSSCVLPKSDDALIGFWMGNSVVPWKEWIMPIVLWTLFVFAAVWAFMCIAAIFYHRWDETEHLLFPITVPILELSSYSGSTEEANTWKLVVHNRLLWVSAIVFAVLFVGLPEAHKYFPAVPVVSPISLDPILIGLGPNWQAGFWAHYPVTVNRELMFDPVMVGIMYNVTNSDVLFSIWALNLLYLLYRTVLASLGFYPGGYFGWMQNSLAAPDEISFGAYIGLAGLLVWTARFQIRTIFTRALRTAASDRVEPKDANDAAPERVLVFGGLVSVVFLILFANIFLGMRIIWSILFFLFAFACALSAARIRAEGGVPLVTPFGSAYDKSIMATIFGYELAGAQSLVAGDILMSCTYGGLGLSTIIGMESYRMADETKMKRSSMTKAIMIAVAAGTISIFAIGLTTIYRYGGYNLFRWSWPIQAVTNAMRSSGTNSIETYSQPNLERLIFVVVGFVGVLVTGIIRMNVLRWPFHPIGVALASNGFTAAYLSSAFLVWLIKWLLVRYGGGLLLKKARPVFLGMVIGPIVLKAVFLILGVILFGFGLYPGME